MMPPCGQKIAAENTEVEKLLLFDKRDVKREKSNV